MESKRLGYPTAAASAVVIDVILNYNEIQEFRHNPNPKTSDWIKLSAGLASFLFTLNPVTAAPAAINESINSAGLWDWLYKSFDKK